MEGVRRTRLLIVAGHDPSGAGIDADLAAAAGLDLEAIAVVTARTDQDARAVRSVGARESRAWGREALESARGGVDAVKFGLLPGVDHVREARALVRELRALARESASGGERSSTQRRTHLPERAPAQVPARAQERALEQERARQKEGIPVVVDPVIRATSGGLFLDARAVEVLRGELVADGVVLTPNLTEAAELACVPLRELETSFPARVEAARILLALGAKGVVIKGGHGREDPVRDLIARADGVHRWIERPRLPGPGIRGSGCRFATRLAGGLALGKSLEEAAEAAGSFVAAEIARRSAEGQRLP